MRVLFAQIPLLFPHNLSQIPILRFSIFPTTTSSPIFHYCFTFCRPPLVSETSILSWPKTTYYSEFSPVHTSPWSNPTFPDLFECGEPRFFETNIPYCLLTIYLKWLALVLRCKPEILLAGRSRCSTTSPYTGSISRVPKSMQGWKMARTQVDQIRTSLMDLRRERLISCDPTHTTRVHRMIQTLL